ncbi:MAG: HTH-type transcriptional regulator IscR [Syntrophomonadaceae bacterium]|nr:HTH-type transcriptional regulator IscR [Bacillota bacterium]
MKITTKVQYAVRALFDLAYHGDGGPAQIKEISQRQKISPRYLEQIFHQLKKADLLETKRGPRGGYSLKKPAGEITLSQIVQVLEGPLELVPCLRPKDTQECDLEESCVAKMVWQELQDKMESHFNALNLEELCRRARDMGIKREIRHRYMYYI